VGDCGERFSSLFISTNNSREVDVHWNFSFHGDVPQRMSGRCSHSSTPCVLHSVLLHGFHRPAMVSKASRRCHELRDRMVFRVIHFMSSPSFLFILKKWTITFWSPCNASYAPSFKHPSCRSPPTSLPMFIRSHRKSAHRSAQDLLQCCCLMMIGIYLVNIPSHTNCDSS